MFLKLINFNLFNNIHYNFFAFESLLIFLISLVILHLFVEVEGVREIRILVFFIYFELIHLFLSLFFLVWALFDLNNSGLYITIVLLLIGASGAETGLFFALFIRYFKLTGTTVFLNNNKASHFIIISVSNTSFKINNDKINKKKIKVLPNNFIVI